MKGSPNEISSLDRLSQYTRIRSEESLHPFRDPIDGSTSMSRAELGWEDRKVYDSSLEKVLAA